MSMPISNLIKVATIGLFLLLGACVEQQENYVAEDPVDGSDQMRRLVLERGGRLVIIVPPRGFCIDPDSTHHAAVLAGDCTALGVRPLGPPSSTLALMSASVSDAALPGSGRLRARIASLEVSLQAGRLTALLTQGNSNAHLIKTRLSGDSLYALIEEPEHAAFDGASRQYWRVLSEVNGRMIVLTVRALDTYWPGEEALLERAIAFRESIRRANSAPV